MHLRRQLLLAAAASAAAPLLAAQPSRTGSRALVVAQIFDGTPAQQDVAKDFLIGSRAAWQDIQARGGIRGRPVVHQNLEVDGTPQSLRAALDVVRANPDCVVLSGTCGDAVSVAAVQALRQDPWPIAHAAPWLQNAELEIDDRTFAVFAGRREQIGHALRSFSQQGMQELGAVYATQADHRLHAAEMQRTAAGLKLRLAEFRGEDDLAGLGQRLAADAPAILLFLGGTPELVQFTQGLERQQRQRYLVAMADVNLQTLQQMGAGRSTPVIATQPVPLVNARLPLVRHYRETLGRLFDEPPAALSLAGFIAARYTFEVLAGIAGPVTRASALAAFQRREAQDLGGYRIAFDGHRRGSAFVTQTLLTADGRLVG